MDLCHPLMIVVISFVKVTDVCRCVCVCLQRICVDEGHSGAWDDCGADFPAFAVGAADARSGDSQNCRKYHLGVANATDPDIHCLHASRDGDGVCVAPQFCADFQVRSSCVFVVFG